MANRNKAAGSRVSGFVAKAFEIFSDGQNGDICGWGREGKTVVVRRIADFENMVRFLSVKLLCTSGIIIINTSSHHFCR